MESWWGPGPIRRSQEAPRGGGVGSKLHTNPELRGLGWPPDASLMRINSNQAAGLRPLLLADLLVARSSPRGRSGGEKKRRWSPGLRFSGSSGREKSADTLCPVAR